MENHLSLFTENNVNEITVYLLAKFVNGKMLLKKR